MEEADDGIVARLRCVAKESGLSEQMRETVEEAVERLIEASDDAEEDIALTERAENAEEACGIAREMIQRLQDAAFELEGKALDRISPLDQLAFARRALGETLDEKVRELIRSLAVAEPQTKKQPTVRRL